MQTVAHFNDCGKSATRKNSWAADNSQPILVLGFTVVESTTLKINH